MGNFNQASEQKSQTEGKRVVWAWLTNAAQLGGGPASNSEFSSRLKISTSSLLCIGMHRLRNILKSFKSWLSNRVKDGFAFPGNDTFCRKKYNYFCVTYDFRSASISGILAYLLCNLFRLMQFHVARCYGLVCDSKITSLLSVTRPWSWSRWGI